MTDERPFCLSRDPKTGLLCSLRAGHEDMCLGWDNTVQWAGSPGFPIEWSGASCQRCSGSGVVATSDGEAMDCPRCDGPIRLLDGASREESCQLCGHTQLVPKGACIFCPKCGTASGGCGG